MPPPNTRTAIPNLRQATHAQREQERARTEDLLSQASRNMGPITDAFHEIGEALTELNDNHLHLALGQVPPVYCGNARSPLSTSTRRNPDAAPRAGASRNATAPSTSSAAEPTPGRASRQG